ncbi:unnamed protein product [Musa acuminata var. zebrina]
MKACITPLPEVSSPDEAAGGELKEWPERAFSVPPRISKGSIPALTSKKFEDDNIVWKERVTHYKNIIPALFQGQYRNVMDMNAYLGGFVAALMKYPVWVMNVVPANSDYDTLGVIYERGFIGTYFRCRCDITYILWEMDRILRPEGTVIIRDTVDVLTKVQSITDRMRWKSRTMDHESGPFNPEKILLAVKTYWTAEPST